MLQFARAAVSKISADALLAKALSVRRSQAGSLLKTIRKVNAKKLQESDILVGHRFHTAGAEPYFFDNSKSVEENRAAKRQKYEDNSAAIKASERNRYWYDPAVRLAKRAAERKRYRRGHRTTTTTQRYVMACCIALALKSYRKMCMQHVYSTHVRDLHKTIHFTCKSMHGDPTVVYCTCSPFSFVTCLLNIGVSSLI